MVEQLSPTADNGHVRMFVQIFHLLFQAVRTTQVVTVDQCQILAPRIVHQLVVTDGNA